MSWTAFVHGFIMHLLRQCNLYPVYLCCCPTILHISDMTNYCVGPHRTKVRVRVRVQCCPMWSDAVISHTFIFYFTFYTSHRMGSHLRILFLSYFMRWLILHFCTWRRLYAQSLNVPLDQFGLVRWFFIPVLLTSPISRSSVWWLWPPIPCTLLWATQCWVYSQDLF